MFVLFLLVKKRKQKNKTDINESNKWRPHHKKLILKMILFLTMCVELKKNGNSSQ